MVQEGLKISLKTPCYTPGHIIIFLFQIVEKWFIKTIFLQSEILYLYATLNLSGFIFTVDI